MAIVAISAEASSLILNGTAINDFVEGDFIEITPVNPLTTQTNGANGGVNINKRLDGDVVDLVFRVLRYSESDVFMTNAVNQVDPVVFNGTVKENFQRDGADFVENWVLESGSATTLPTSTKNNQDGNNTVEYTIRFRSGTRLL